MLQFDSIDSAFVHVISSLLTDGHEVDSRNGMSKECIGAQIILKDINHPFLLNKRRKLSPYYACAEVLWYLKFTNSIAMIADYAPQYEKYADEDGYTYGAYGFRMWHNLDDRHGLLKNQLSLVIETLRNNSNSRQAIITLWEANDLYSAINASSKDVPCTLSLQYIVRNGRLHAITTMRSNDAWLGMPYDVFAFTCFQRLIAQALGIKCGTYTHQVGSLHLYEKHWEAAYESLSAMTLFDGNIPIWPDEEMPEYQFAIKECCRVEEAIRTGQRMISTFSTNGVSEMMFDLVATVSHKWQGGTPLVTSAQLLKGINNVNS